MPDRPGQPAYGPTFYALPRVEEVLAGPAAALDAVVDLIGATVP
ncbi:hypothetical protein [Pengzhenrongella sicca]|nr:hypothetical protein [Pengzhenrongella sicca]